MPEIIKISFEDMEVLWHEFIQASSGGMPAPLDPVFAQHGWETGDFYKEQTRRRELAAKQAQQ